MPDFSSIVEKLEGLQQQLEQLKDDLGQLAAQPSLDALTPGLTPRIPVFVPSEALAEIVDGQETLEFPDCCAIGNAIGFYCTGTLIAPNLVVTADHCKEATRVFLNGNDISKPNEGETIAVLHQLEHPEVDLRILVLERPATVKPRPIAQGAEIQQTKSAMVVGFGTINTEGTVGYGIKRKLAKEIPITSISCSDPTDPKKYGCLPGRELVAGHRGLRADTCRGDSGGPLYIKNASGEYLLLGATSRGVKNGFTTCGDGGVYVRVDLCVDWIEQETGVKLGGSST